MQSIAGAERGIRPGKHYSKTLLCLGCCAQTRRWMDIHPQGSGDGVLSPDDGRDGEFPEKR
jgi:hypothetical protein